MKSYGWILILVLAGGLLRYLASSGDFWFDEIWTWNLINPVQNPIAIITELHHDNNHILNSLWMWCLGSKASFVLYRLPCIILGTLAVAVVGLSWPTNERAQRLIATLLFTFSFFCIQYSSEARGYGYLMFFTTAATALVLRSKYDALFNWEMIAFWFCCLFGFLSHATFTFAWLTLALVNVSTVWRQASPISRKVGAIASWYFVPAICLLFVWTANYRHLEIGGGDSEGTLSVVLATFSLTIGGPVNGVLMLIFAIVAMSLLLAALIHASATRIPVAIMGWVGIIVFPLLTLLILKPSPLYPRYFLVPFVFTLIVLANFLAFLWDRGKPARITVAIALCAFVLANMNLAIPLMREGRGHYRAALEAMNDMSSDSRILVASDHDFRNLMILDFYHRRMDSLKIADYIPEGKWPVAGPEWVILHDWRHDFSPPRTFPDQAGNIYVKIDEYHYAGLSGFHWAIYHNRNRPLSGSF